MNAQIAYEAYRESLKSRTRKWHELKAQPEHNEMSAEVFDAWVHHNRKDEITFYFMGEYKDMPSHTIAGWMAFAEHASEGAEEAWNSYCEAARLNFKKDKGFFLPRYAALTPDQQIAVEFAVMKVLEQSPSFKP